MRTTTSASIRLVLPIVVPITLAVLVLGLAAAQSGDSLTRLTAASDPDRDSFSSGMNTAGTKVAIQSDSDFLGEGLLDAQTEIWLYDTAAMTFTRITMASDSDRDSLGATLSADGTKVVFLSDSDFLGEGIPDEQYEVWLYDTTAMTLTRLTHASSADRDSFPTGLNADGTKVVLYSDSDFLGQGIPDNQEEVWLYDSVTMTATRITTASDPDRDSGRPSLNAAGTKIAFDSDSDFLGQGILYSQREIWLYDTATMTLTRVTTSDSNRSSISPKLSADGTKVVFWSEADFLDQGIPSNQLEIWLYDTIALTLTRVTTASDSERDSRNAQISADGTKVAFWSDSDFLGQGIPDEQGEIWQYDMVTKALIRLTTASDSERDSVSPYLSADGTKVVFTSDSDFLGDGIPDDQYEIWLKTIPMPVYLPLIIKQVP